MLAYLEMGGEMEEHLPYIYRSTYWAPGMYIVDCEEHEVSYHTPFFFDAVGRAFLHRAAVVR